MTRSLVSHLFEHKLSAFREAWLDLNLLSVALVNASLCIMLNNFLSVIDLLNRAIEKLFERALSGNDDITRSTSSLLIQASKAVSKDALLRIRAINCSIFPNEVRALQLLLVVILRACLQKVTASNFLCNIERNEQGELSYTYILQEWCIPLSVHTRRRYHRLPLSPL